MSSSREEDGAGRAQRSSCGAEGGGLPSGSIRMRQAGAPMVACEEAALAWARPGWANWLNSAAATATGQSKRTVRGRPRARPGRIAGACVMGALWLYASGRTPVNGTSLPGRPGLEPLDVHGVASTSSSRSVMSERPEDSVLTRIAIAARCSGK
jgi:hypothetical protein